MKFNANFFTPELFKEAGYRYHNGTWKKGNTISTPEAAMDAVWSYVQLRWRDETSDITRKTILPVIQDACNRIAQIVEEHTAIAVSRFAKRGDEAETPQWVEDVRNGVFYVDVTTGVRVHHNYVTKKDTIIHDNALAAAFDAETRAAIRSETAVVHFGYHPYNQAKFGKRKIFSGHENIFNTYQPPVWRYPEFFNITREKPTNDKIPKIVEEHLHHLFDGDAPTIQYCLDWMANSLKRRNPTALGLVGTTEGSGKTQLLTLLFLVHGFKEENAYRVKADQLNKEFNAFLKNRTFILCDEIKAGDEAAANRLKEWVGNSYGVYEGKGENSTQGEIFYSLAFTSNLLNAIKVDDGDRRFSLLDVTETSIKDRPDTPARMDLLVSDDVVAAFGEYLYFHHVIQNNMNVPWVGKIKQRMISANMAGWQHLLTEAIQDNSIQAYQDDEGRVKMARLKQFFNDRGEEAIPGRTKLEQFFDRNKKLGTFKKSGGEYYLTPQRDDTIFNF
jgi:hypothetical protein